MLTVVISNTSLRGIDTLLGETMQSKLLFFPSDKGSSLKGKNKLPIFYIEQAILYIAPLLCKAILLRLVMTISPLFFTMTPG